MIKKGLKISLLVKDKYKPGGPNSFTLEADCKMLKELLKPP